ncbi:MAG TPA: PLP-dependent aminotransferase family protein [Firmicutes bacterium]|nr:PLP-dependent aminotransferase family protein [Bacillota bacterium]
MSGNIIREILKLTKKPDIISFAGGLPSPDSFPVEELRQIAGDIFAGDPGFLQYGTTEGLPELRESLAAWVAEVGIDAHSDQVLILTGSQQGIDLACKALLNPGDTVIVERPTYLAAIQIFKMYGANIVAVPGDERGMDLEALAEAAAAHRAKMVYIISNFQNPSGITWSLEKRQQLAALADELGFIIVEDDPYGRLRYSGSSEPAVSGLNRLKRSLYLGSFSKVVSPGLRIGYAVGPAPLIRAMVIGKQGTDVHSSNLSQRIVLELMRRGILARHIPKICAQYGMKRDVMLSALAEHLPAQVSWTKPAGGLFIWVTLPQKYSVTKLLERAVEEKVAFIPGIPFFLDGSGDNCMRLNFSNASPEQIRTGIARIAKVIAEADK